ncbi:HARBI1 [Mytilus edulis]|uniref:HARBI1 n=1 Tax=Mytilus edulis TaxID=6550 RepID=A0A8S3S4D3_MYTED|nr:HARBI1 [Mytilus edulis]
MIQTLFTESMLQEKVLTSFLDQRRKGLHIIGTPGNGKSYITNFLCTLSSAEYNWLCNKIIFYHICSLDDPNSSSAFLFIKQFSESIISRYPYIGQQIYFDQNIQPFFQEEFCLYDLNECAKTLILAPLKKVSTNQPGRKHIILMDYLDDCLVSGKDMNIIHVLRTLIQYLPQQFKFLFISRRYKYEFIDLDFLSIDSVATLRIEKYTKGLCVQDAMGTFIPVFVVLCVIYAHIVGDSLIIIVFSNCVSFIHSFYYKITIKPGMACKMIFVCAILHNICILLNELDIEDDGVIEGNDSDLEEHFNGHQD